LNITLAHWLVGAEGFMYYGFLGMSYYFLRTVIGFHNPLVRPSFLGVFAALKILSHKDLIRTFKMTVET
jgi:hypothetical protein